MRVSSLVPPLLLNLSIPPTDLLHRQPKTNPFPHTKVLARLCRRNKFRTLSRALSLLERNRRLMTTHPPRSCALRRAPPTSSLRRAMVASKAKMGRQRQPSAQTARRRTRHCGGGIRKGSLCVSGFPQGAIYGCSAEEVRFFPPGNACGLFYVCSLNCRR